MALSAKNLANYAYKRSNKMRADALRAWNAIQYDGPGSGVPPIPPRISTILEAWGGGGADLEALAQQAFTTFTVADFWPAIGSDAEYNTAFSGGQGLGTWPELMHVMVDGGTMAGGVFSAGPTGGASSGQIAALRALVDGSSYAGNALTDPLSALLAFAVADWTPTP